MQSPPKLQLALAVSVCFALGAASGVFFQRAFGVGNTLRAVGLWPPMPTTGPRFLVTPMPTGIAEAYQGRLSLFILAGQSNMSGRGDLPTAQPVHPQVFVFGNDYRWRLGADPLDSPFEQVDQVSIDRGEEMPGVGPGMAFAAALLEQEPELVIGLIPCAQGGTTLDQWRPSRNDQTLYGSCLKRARAASTMGSIAGVLFFQGEADAVDLTQVVGPIASPFTYAEAFESLVAGWRSDLDRPNLPIVFAQIGSNAAPDYFVNWQIVQQQQAAVDLPCAAMITTADLPLRDAVHFTSESYYVIGQRFVDAYLDLLRSQPCLP